MSEATWKKFKRLTPETKVIAVICTQWGDSGKGKIVDLLADWADVVIRGTGGGNAGHTIWVNGRKYVVHIIPSGIVRSGKLNIIGPGVVMDPRAVLQEMEILKAGGIDCQGRLLISNNAKLVMPYHIAIDRLRESGKGKIGTTGRGIGPAYEDHYRRIGLTANDLLNYDAFRQKLEAALEEYNRLLKTFDPETVEKVMGCELLEKGFFYDDFENMFDWKAIAERYLACGQQLSEMICDTESQIAKTLESGRHILLEGAQGNMLSVDYGSYPYVTSSDCTVQGLAKGAGLSESDVDLTVAIAKAFYMTRVGGGPFPTEMGGNESAKWCAGANREKEEAYLQDNPDEHSDFRLGMAIRAQGDEYGATTKRPRRTGWLDLPLLRYSLKHCGKNATLALTKVDVLSDQKEIKVCTAYRYTGPDYRLGGHTLRKGEQLAVAIPHNDVMQYCEPVYQTLPGWMQDISGIRDWNELPKELINLLSFLQIQTGAQPEIISVGKDREQTIF